MHVFKFKAQAHVSQKLRGNYLWLNTCYDQEKRFFSFLVYLTSIYSSNNYGKNKVLTRARNLLSPVTFHHPESDSHYCSH